MYRLAAVQQQVPQRHQYAVSLLLSLLLLFSALCVTDLVVVHLSSPTIDICKTVVFTPSRFSVQKATHLSTRKQVVQSVLCHFTLLSRNMSEGNYFVLFHTFI